MPSAGPSPIQASSALRGQATDQSKLGHAQKIGPMAEIRWKFLFLFHI
jgi:hypothetical protein